MRSDRSVGRVLVNSSAFRNGLYERSDTQPGIVNNGVTLLDRNKSLRKISPYFYDDILSIKTKNLKEILLVFVSSSINDVHILLRRLHLFKNVYDDVCMWGVYISYCMCVVCTACVACESIVPRSWFSTFTFMWVPRLKPEYQASVQALCLLSPISGPRGVR